MKFTKPRRKSVLMDIDKEEFKRRFPCLAKEMHGSEDAREPADGLEPGRDAFQGYMPNAIDYLRRCDNDQQGAETIDHLERSKEISKDYAQALRSQLQKKGVRSFGPKKQEDYYLKQYLGNREEQDSD